MITFLLILIAVTLIFGADIGLWTLIISSVGLLILGIVALSVRNPEISQTILEIVGGILLVCILISAIKDFYKEHGSIKNALKKALLPPIKIGALVCLSLITLWFGTYFLLTFLNK